MIASLKKVDNWIRKHNPKWLALIRVAVGASLLIRGEDYLQQADKLLIEVHTHLPFLNDMLAISIPWIHIVGGFLIILGLFTRFAAILQIPVLAMGIVYVNLHTKVFATTDQFYFSILYLFLLIVFVIEGSGKLSLARYFKEEDEDDEDEEEVEEQDER